MLEKIDTPGYEFLSKPDSSVIKYMNQIITRKSDPIYYEIGVGIGATTLPVAKTLNNAGKIFLFSRENEVRELASDLAQLGYSNIDASWGSPAKTYSGYHFELARGLLDGRLPLFDLAYVDGGHFFHLDAPAACILKELCIPGGYILFDDYQWSLASSPSLNPTRRPATLSEYDQLQIDACHVEMVCKSIMNTDARFELIDIVSDTAIYKKRRTDSLHAVKAQIANP
jgi:hypothetical protein